MNNTLSADRIASLPTTIFTTMSRLALEHQAVNLGQGFPDFDGPEWIMEEAFKAMREGKNQYAPMNGTLSLRRAIASYQKRFYDLEWDEDREITVTAGATEALFSTILALVNPGDEVLLFEPYYDSHHANVLIAGGVPKCITLKKPDFTFSEEEIERECTPQTKLLILNNPNNPTGKVFTAEELETLVGIVRKHELIVVSDEVYEFLTFDARNHIPIATLPGMRERTVTVSSTGKTFGMTGWKIGYAIASPPLTEAIQKVHQFATFAVNTPGQHAMAFALTNLEDYLPEFRTMYLRKRDALYAGLQRSAFHPHQTAGSYFMMVDIPSTAQRDDVQCALELVRQHGVATIPPSVFYSKSDEGKTMLRLCFAKRDETLKEGLQRLRNVV